MTPILPAILYRSPGQQRKPGGGTYNFTGVETQDEFDSKLAEGWFTSSAEAIAAAGDKADGIKKPKPKWATKPTKKKKPANPIGSQKQPAPAPAEAAQVESGPISDTAAPTRDELEAKATELGIRFDGRTKDKKLGQLIEDRLSATTGE